MSYLTDTDVNKRAGNLYIAFTSAFAPPPGPDSIMTLRANAPDMQFLAQYQAAFPAATPIGGTWEAANTGGNGFLSADQNTVTFLGEASTIGTFSVNAAVVTPCWEIAMVNVPVAPTLSTAGTVNDPGLASYDSSRYVGGGFVTGCFATYYESDGTLRNLFAVQGAAPALVSGDVVGFVCTDATIPGAGHIFLNGVLVGNVDVNDNTVTAMASRAF